MMDTTWEEVQHAEPGSFIAGLGTVAQINTVAKTITLANGVVLDFSAAPAPAPEEPEK